MSTTSTQIRLAQRPHGEPADDTYEFAEAQLPSLNPGELALRVVYLSLDPYMRGRMNDGPSYATPVDIGDVMVGATVCQVTESTSQEFSAGDWVLSYSGWQTYAIAKDTEVRRLHPGTAPLSTALGVLGMPGFTAYAGLLEIGKPHQGETVVVAAATGPVGSAVGQIAKARGARAVGIAGGPKKCAALLDEFGFDAAVDHRASTFADDLAAALPHGIDVYFENVGGQVTKQILRHVNKFARIPVCGLVSGYNATQAPEGPDRLPGFMGLVLTKSLTVRGFIQDEFTAAYGREFVREMSGWLADGTVSYREDIYDGLESAPEAFRGLLSGANFGKVIVQVGHEKL